MDASHKHVAEWLTPDAKEDMPHATIYMKVRNRQTGLWSWSQDGHSPDKEGGDQGLGVGQVMSVIWNSL